MKVLFFLKCIAPVLLCTGCNMNVHLYHHFPDGKPLVLNNTIVAPPKPVRKNSYAILYIRTSPALASVKIVGGGRPISSSIVGKTPLTIRMLNGESSILTPEMCGKDLGLLAEKEGYKLAVTNLILRCFHSESQMEANQNEIFLNMSPR